MVRWFDELEGCVETLIDRWFDRLLVRRFVGSMDRWFVGLMCKIITGSLDRLFVGSSDTFRTTVDGSLAR